MAITDLASADTELAARGYARFSQARRFVWLNSAKNRLEDYPVDWPWLKATTTGTAPLTISTLRRVLSVADTTNHSPLPGADLESVVNFADTNLAQVGQPSVWYLSDETTLTTYPLGASTLSVRYVKFSPELASGDSPLIPARYRQVWVDLAEVDALRYGVKDRDSAAAMEAEVFRRIGELGSVYSMQGQAAYTEPLDTGESVDG